MATAWDHPTNFIVGDISAKYFNSTLVTFGHLTSIIYASQRYNSLFPLMLPTVQTFGSSHQILNIWDYYYHSRNTAELPTIFPKERLDYNFAYCSISEPIKASVWNFSIFTDPFDVWSWLVMGLLIISTSWLVSISSRINFDKAFLSVLATAVDNEMSRIYNSKLYIIWLFVSLIIVDFYSGAITSQVIAPPDELRLKKIQELDEHNYTLIFPNKIYSNLFNETLVALKAKDYAPANLGMVWRLTINSKIYDRLSGAFVDAIVNKHYATLLWWPHSMFAAALGNSEIKKDAEHSKWCTVGNDMFNIGDRYVIFTPPGSTRLGKMFAKLLTSGIPQRWNHEHYQILQSARVQDRGRVKSKMVVSKEGANIRALKLEGKTLTIFLLWIFCLVLCSISFLGEKIKNTSGDAPIGLFQLYRSTTKHSTNVSRDRVVQVKSSIK